LGAGKSPPSGQSGGFRVVDERVLFRGWRNVVGRTVRYPSGNLVEFHVVSQSVPPPEAEAETREGDPPGSSHRDEAVLVVAFDRPTRTFTLVKEYMPSRHGLVLGMAAGMVEGCDDASATGGEGGLADDVILAGAVRELAEECRLDGGPSSGAEWIRLTPPLHGTVMDKYCTTSLHAYLVVNARPFPHEQDDVMIDGAGDGSAVGPHQRDDAEEGMEVVRGMTPAQLLECVRSGELTVVGSWAALLALQRLREMGEL
jgi:8-oxo-dGTP pyrophosphatase MutT (NUDIX family)